MGTNIRPTITKNNKYWISKHRYYELKHFCLQYSEWKKMYLALGTSDFQSHYISQVLSKNTDISDPTAKIASKRAILSNWMKAVEHAALAADKDLAPYIFKAVTEEISCDNLIMNGMPCCKDVYYDRYRKFFWILSNMRN